MTKLLSPRWWNERVVPVPRHMQDDWIAPRWYLVIVALAYTIMLGIFVFGMTQVPWRELL